MKTQDCAPVAYQAAQTHLGNRRMTIFIRDKMSPSHYRQACSTPAERCAPSWSNTTAPN